MTIHTPGGKVFQPLSSGKAERKEIEQLEKGYDALLDDRNEAWERVAELEAALHQIIDYHDIGGEHVINCRRIAKQALGERDE